MSKGAKSGDAESKPVALVTGANRGIGRAIAVHLAKEGFDIAVNDVSETEETAETLSQVSKYSAHSAFLPFDISHIEDRQRYVSSIVRKFGRLDCLVNNAGVVVQQRGDILDVTEAAFDRQVQINLRGTFFLTQEVARQMLEIGERNHPRSIVTISSFNAVLVGTNRAEYCIAKSALPMMVQQFAVRLAAEGIACFEVRPGIIERAGRSSEANAALQQMISEGLCPISRMGEPDDIGKAVAVLAKAHLPYCTGEVFHVDGGLSIRRVP